MEIQRHLVWGNKLSCVYLAVDRDYQYNRSGINPLVKIGFSRSMGKRRGRIAYDYGVKTIYEIPADDNLCEIIENDLRNWLHNAPTSQYRSQDCAYINASVFELMMEQFRVLVAELEIYHRGH